LIFCFLEFL